MDLSLVFFAILVGITMILAVIILISHVMELRDRPGCFIVGVLGIVALLIFLIWLIFFPHDSNPNPLNGGTPVLP